MGPSALDQYSLPQAPKTGLKANFCGNFRVKKS